jgi:hypothetical protein
VADRIGMRVTAMVSGSEPNGLAFVDIQGYVGGKFEETRHVSEHALHIAKAKARGE